MTHLAETLDTITETAPEIAPGPVTLAAVDLAAHLNGRLCHDLISPLSALTSALDLFVDPDAADMRDDALELMQASVVQLTSKLSFARIAFGAASSSHAFEAADLKALIDAAFAKSKAEVDWRIGAYTFTKPAGRALINLSMIAAECLPRGGTACFEMEQHGDTLHLHITATGPRAKLRSETLLGLSAAPAPDGLAGLWIQPYYTHALLQSVGGSVRVETAEERVDLFAQIPVTPDLPLAAFPTDSLTSSTL